MCLCVCIFLCPNFCAAVLRGQFAEAQLNADLANLNEEIERFTRGPNEPIKVIAVRRLDFVEAFSWVELLAGLLVVVIIVAVALVLGGGGVRGVSKFVKVC